MQEQQAKQAPKMYPLEPSDAQRIQTKNGEIHTAYNRIGQIQIDIMQKQEDMLRLGGQIEGLKGQMNEMATEMVKKYGAKSIDIATGQYEKMSDAELSKSLIAIEEREAQEAEMKERSAEKTVETPVG